VRDASQSASQSKKKTPIWSSWRAGEREGSTLAPPQPEPSPDGAVHARVRGTLDKPASRFPAGTPYRADDPELLLWILAALADSAMLVYGKYVGRLDRDAVWRDYRVVGELFGLTGDEMPGTAAELDAYVRGMIDSGDLYVTEPARALAVEIVLHPPVPLHLRPLLELVNQTTVGLLPPAVRRMYGFSWDPLRSLALHGGAEYVKRMVVPVLPGRIARLPQARAA
jgi:uncharacterized protein (DUF2236 family)